MPTPSEQPSGAGQSVARSVLSKFQALEGQWKQHQKKVVAHGAVHSEALKRSANLLEAANRKLGHRDAQVSPRPNCLHPTVTSIISLSPSSLQAIHAATSFGVNRPHACFKRRPCCRLGPMAGQSAPASSTAHSSVQQAAPPSSTWGWGLSPGVMHNLPCHPVLPA